MENNPKSPLYKVFNLQFREYIEYIFRMHEVIAVDFTKQYCALLSFNILKYISIRKLIS